MENVMEYRQLGPNGPRVSRLCLGTMTFGDRTAESEAKRIVEIAKQTGVNFIDTADLYNNGESERLLGKLLAEERDQWVLATKVGNKIPGDSNSGGLSRKWINTALDASRRRLNTDVIDVYYLHLDDNDTQQDETLQAIGDALSHNRIRYWGVSNFRAYRIVALALRAQRLGVPPPLVCQPYYNALNRMPEVEVLPACQEYSIAVVPYSPLARGVLTGKYHPGTTPEADSRVGVADKRILQTEFREESLYIAQKIAARAQELNMTAGQWALNWVLANSLVDAALVGPRTPEQLNEYLGAMGRPWGLAEEAFLDGLVAPGHPSTPGYTDPKYPVRGRSVSKDTLLA